jgi:hypothetical protein
MEMHLQYCLKYSECDLVKRVWKGSFKKELLICAPAFESSGEKNETLAFRVMPLSRLNAGRKVCRVFNAFIIFISFPFLIPVTVAERSKAYTVFARLEDGILGSNPTQGMDVWYVFVLSYV